MRTINNTIITNGIHKLKQIFLRKYDREFIVFLKHGSRYTTARFFVSAISFIALPIYTRLLTPSEYGILAVFNSAVGIFAIIYGLQMYGSVGRYYLEKKDDFSDFLGTNIFALITLIIIQGIIFWIFRASIMNFFALPISLFPLLVAISIASFGFAIYGNLLVVKRKSSEYISISIMKAVLIVLISVVIMYHLKSERYLGRIYAQILVTFTVFGYCIYKLLAQTSRNFKIRHLKYSINYNIPAIPGALSGFILTFFDRIIINQLTTSEKTGLYSLAYNIAMVLGVIYGGLFAAWFPTFVEDMRDQQYRKIQLLTSRFADIIMFVALLIALFSNEIMHIMSPAKYHSGLHLIPIIVMGYVFLFVANVYSYFASYRKEKIFVMSINLLIVVAINILLNYILIPKFGYSIAAITTALSYFLLMFLNFFTVRYLLRESVLHLKTYLSKITITFLFFILLYGITAFAKEPFALSIKAIAIVVWGYIVFIKK